MSGSRLMRQRSLPIPPECDRSVPPSNHTFVDASRVARGRTTSSLEAEANKTMRERENEGQEARLIFESSPFGTPPQYIEYLAAKAALHWNAQQTQVVAGTNRSTSILAPMPANTGKKGWLTAPAPNCKSG